MELVTVSFQNPVFIPGPTNIPEDLRQACDMLVSEGLGIGFTRQARQARNAQGVCEQIFTWGTK